VAPQRGRATLHHRLGRAPDALRQLVHVGKRRKARL
jgi:hypothetical protein